MSLPRVFIGSSKESIKIAEAIQENFEYEDIDPAVWNQGIFGLSQSTLDNLLNALDGYDFGIFVFAPDDIAKIRDKRYSVARDNVLFEFGLFIGRLGKDRSFFILPRVQEGFHIPTDLIGVTPGTYDHRKENLQAALSHVCRQIKTEIKKLGIISRAQRNRDILTSDLIDTLKHLTARTRSLARVGIRQAQGKRASTKNAFWISRGNFQKYLGRMMKLHREEELRVICYSLISTKTIQHDIADFLKGGGKLRVLMLDPESPGFFEKTALESFADLSELEGQTGQTGVEVIEEWKYVTEETRNSHADHISSSIGQLRKWRHKYRDKVDFRLYSDTPNLRVFMLGQKAMCVSSYFYDPTAPGHDNPHLFVNNLGDPRIDPSLRTLTTIISNWFEVKFAAGRQP